MANITLMWDPMPATEAWKEVRIYEGITKVATAIPPVVSVTLSVTKAPHTWVARSVATDSAGEEYESVDSNSVTWAPPLPPGRLRK